ncbi:uncharacterized protein PGRI_075730 [Penicillium griseofulvum]|uniref:Protein kinase domain-containing protein n=1 Tax=Penicillium patulum TaxID=5078 RepID=A0A135LZP3_PENPA|nr:uncharacterized protein PGRI_075730 [Penicillium griseofulvum]KXG54429.1 hypothetical protein PGRI_075730 [Penicillium griseofulvum]
MEKAGMKGRLKLERPNSFHLPLLLPVSAHLTQLVEIDSYNHLFRSKAATPDEIRECSRILTAAPISLLHPPIQSTVKLQSYSENQDYLVQGTPETSSRSQTLVYRSGDCEWWIKVTFVGLFSRALHASEKRSISKRELREKYQAFVKLIQYNSLPLLDDTVTEVILEIAPETVGTIQLKHEATNNVNSYAMLARRLTYQIREDPSRVLYPLCDEFPSFRNIHLADLIDGEEITDGVFRVSHKHDSMHYIHKVVNRPLYFPHDTDVIRSELENLKCFHGVPNIVQQAGIVVSPNPYMTLRGFDQPLVVNGILLKYYTGGSLRDVLSKGQVAMYPWKRWGIQIATALSCLHTARKSHMDIKTSNVVLDAEGNAIVIDISGIGGMTYEWRAPEVRDILSPIGLPFERRRLNDIWAYGKLLSEIAAHAEDCPYLETLRSVAAKLMEEDTQIRMTLSEAISQLEAGACN